MNQLFNRLYTSVSLHNNTIVTRPINDWIIEIDYILYRLINRDPSPPSPLQKWKTDLIFVEDEYMHCRSKSHSYIVDIIYFRWHKSRRRVFKKRVSRNYYYLVNYRMYTRETCRNEWSNKFFFWYQSLKKKKEKNVSTFDYQFSPYSVTNICLYLTYVRPVDN